jgi:polyisoprenoid-binding protein YceI
MLACVATASAALATADDGEVRFTARGPGGLKIEGEGAGVEAKEVEGLLTITAPLKRLKTGIGLRDEHMRDALEVTEHPLATLKVRRDALQVPAEGAETAGSVEGQFALHGVTRAVRLHYEAERKGEKVKVLGRTELDMSAFGIEPPCYLGVCVDKQVAVRVKLELVGN